MYVCNANVEKGRGIYIGRSGGKLPPFFCLLKRQQSRQLHEHQRQSWKTHPTHSWKSATFSSSRLYLPQSHSASSCCSSPRTIDASSSVSLTNLVYCHQNDSVGLAFPLSSSRSTSSCSAVGIKPWRFLLGSVTYRTLRSDSDDRVDLSAQHGRARPGHWRMCSWVHPD